MKERSAWRMKAPHAAQKTLIGSPLGVDRAHRKVVLPAKE